MGGLGYIPTKTFLRQFVKETRWTKSYFCQPRVSSKLIALQAITKIFIKASCYLVNEDLKLYVGVDGVGFGDRQVQFGQRFKIIILTKSYHKITILAWD